MLLEQLFLSVQINSFPFLSNHRNIRPNYELLYVAPSERAFFCFQEQSRGALRALSNATISSKLTLLHSSLGNIEYRNDIRAIERERFILQNVQKDLKILIWIRRREKNKQKRSRVDRISYDNKIEFGKKKEKEVWKEVTCAIPYKILSV